MIEWIISRTGYRFWFFYEIEYRSPNHTLVCTMRRTTGFSSRSAALNHRTLGATAWKLNPPKKEWLCNGYLSLRRISYLGFLKQ